MSPDVLIAQYIVSAYMLGAEFGGEPDRRYLDDTIKTLLDDLHEHGFIICDAHLAELGRRVHDALVEGS